MRPRSRYLQGAKNMTLKKASALLMIVALAACGGGGGNSDSIAENPVQTTLISGIVSDDIVVGATVSVTATDTGIVLGTSATGTDGRYSFLTQTKNIGTGYFLQSAGGTMRGLPFTESLSAMYPASTAARTEPTSPRMTVVTYAPPI